MLRKSCLPRMDCLKLALSGKKQAALMTNTIHPLEARLMMIRKRIVEMMMMFSGKLTLHWTWLAKRIQEQLTSVTADMFMLSANEKEKKRKGTDWALDSPKAASSTLDYSKDENGKTTHEKLVEEVKKNLKKRITANQFQSLLASLSGSHQEVMTALYEALLEGMNKGFAKEVSKKKSYLAAAVAQDEGSQLLLLRAIEEFCKRKSNPYARKEVALVLKALYDDDVLEEESLVKWYGEGVAGSNRHSSLWKNAKPFVDWLQNAESES